MLHPKINPGTLEFLAELKNNNHREWFTAHKARFTAEQANFKAFMAALTQEMNQHDAIDKSKVFRIYRDVRFSNDKTPYKSSFSGFLSRKGSHRRGGYYLHLEPGASFLGAGFWKPEKDDLLRIRKEWEMDAEELRAILRDEAFAVVWGGLQGEEVKSAPKGFHKEHPNSDLIKKKQYVFTKPYTDKEVVSPDFLPSVNAAFKAIRPYFDLMSHILTTNLNGESLVD